MISKDEIVKLQKEVDSLKSKISHLLHSYAKIEDEKREMESKYQRDRKELENQVATCNNMFQTITEELVSGLEELESTKSVCEIYEAQPVEQQTELDKTSAICIELNSQYEELEAEFENLQVEKQSLDVLHKKFLVEQHKSRDEVGNVQFHCTSLQLKNESLLMYAADIEMQMAHLIANIDQGKSHYEALNAKYRNLLANDREHLLLLHEAEHLHNEELAEYILKIQELNHVNSQLQNKVKNISEKSIGMERSFVRETSSLKEILEGHVEKNKDFERNANQLLRENEVLKMQYMTLTKELLESESIAAQKHSMLEKRLTDMSREKTEFQDRSLDRESALMDKIEVLIGSVAEKASIVQNLETQIQRILNDQSGFSEYCNSVRVDYPIILTMRSHEMRIEELTQKLRLMEADNHQLRLTIDKNTRIWCSSRKQMNEVCNITLPSTTSFIKNCVDSSDICDLQCSNISEVYRFTMLLIEEFLQHCNLQECARILREELNASGKDNCTNDETCEMYSKCQEMFRQTIRDENQSTLEKLVEFCTTTITRNHLISDVNAQHKSEGSTVNIFASPISMNYPKPRKNNRQASKPGYCETMTQNVHLNISKSDTSLRNDAVYKSTNLTRQNCHAIDTEECKDDNKCKVYIDLQRDLKCDPSTTCAEYQQKISAGHSSVRGRKKLPRSAKIISSEQRLKTSKSVLAFKSKFIPPNLPHTNAHFGHTHTNIDVHVDFHKLTESEKSFQYIHNATLKHDLSTMRYLEHELRTIRLEHIKNDLRRTKNVDNNSVLKNSTTLPLISAYAPSSELPPNDPFLRELTLERFGFQNRMECALCHVSYLLVNLPHRVSFKRILDVYSKWNFQPIDHDAPKYKPPKCYDAVHVCRMCAEMVFDPSNQVEEGASTQNKLSRANHSNSDSSGRDSNSQEGNVVKLDPYSLPPLYGDDCYDHPTSPNRIVIEDEISQPLISPPKGIGYTSQVDSGLSLNSKEWDIINPRKSSIRARMENSLAQSITSTGD